jgi:hypothetical protein
MELPDDLFDQLSPLIRALPVPVSDDNVLMPEFRLFQHEKLSIYYVPFDYVNDQAQVAIIGVTPGLRQMKSAFQSAAQALRANLSADAVLRQVAQDASFVGSMRTNLVKMLDEIGLARCLGIETSRLLFGERDDLVHTTSAIRYAVFVKGKNYSGHSPSITKTPILRDYIDHYLRDELERVSEALIVPLGKAANKAMQILIDDRAINPERCLTGFPHPSGANGHRKRTFEELEPFLRQTAQEWFDRHG